MSIGKVSIRLSCSVIVLTVLLCLAGCADRAFVRLGDAGVSKGVYAYYLDRVLASPGDYSQDGELTAQQARDAARQLCMEHIAISSLCRERRYTLSNLKKSSVATDTENYWGMFSDHYKSIGMEKQDLTCVKENEAKKALLIEKLYGTDGEDPVKSADIVKALNDTHVGFQAITGYFTKIDGSGNEIPCSEEEKKQIRADFAEMAEKVNDGGNMEKLNKEYNESQSLTGPDKLSVIVIDSKDTTYSESFYAKVKKLKTGKAGVIEAGNYIYVILRADISSKEYVERYSREMLAYLKSDEVEKIVGEWLSRQGKFSSGSGKEIYKTVSQKHPKNK